MNQSKWSNNPPAILASYWPAILIGVTWVWLFWPMMSGEKVCGFRDSAYLYYPLFKWIDAQWMAGEIPLWNPYCNYGMPVVGDGSSSVFYPGKLIFFCRFLSYPSRYGIYLAMHIPIAAAGTYWLAQTFRANKAGATLAASGYAFGGSVLFQVTNVIFLVSAAWLPIAICCVWKMVKTRDTKWALFAATCCSLMILGGDPQMVYHVGLIAVAAISFEAWRVLCRSTRAKHNDQSRPTTRFLLKAGVQLVTMTLVTTVLSAIQLLPTYQWSQRSERSTPEFPANIYQVAASNQPRNTQDRIIVIPPANSIFAEPVGSIEHTYQFSKEPWSLLELFWPNYSGKPFPQHRRWATFAASDRIWSPSTYMGILIALLGISGFRLWGRRRRNIWLTWLFLFFCLGSFGWYGAVWLINLFLTQSMEFDQGVALGPQVGGLYWLMQILLPKYFMFRYPAKLFVIASLALSVLAGINFRKLCETKLLPTVGAFAAVTTIQYFIVTKLIRGQLAPDLLFGAFDNPGSAQDFAVSSIQAVLVVAFGIGIAKLLLKRPNATKNNQKTDGSPMRKSVRSKAGPIAIAILAIVDVAFANHWMLAQIDSMAFTTPVPVTSSIAALKSKKQDASPVQVFRHRDLWRGENWDTASSPDRLAEVVFQQRNSLYPKYHFEHNVVLIGSFCSVWPRYYEKLVTIAEYENPVLNSATVNAPQNSALPKPQLEFDAVVRSGKGPILEEPSETTKLNAPVIWIAPDQSKPDVAISISAFEANRVVARFESASPGNLAFGRIAEPGWYATVHNKSTNETEHHELTLDKARETLWLTIDSAGDYEVEFRYLPREFLIGATVSSIGWVALLIGLFAFRYPRARPPI